MEYYWNVGWDSISQIAVPVCRSSVATSVMAMISYLKDFRVKWFVTNVAFSHFLISSPLILSQRIHRLFRKHMIQPMCFLSDIMTKPLNAILASIEFEWILDLPISKLL